MPQQLFSGILQNFATQGDYDGLTNQQAVKFGIVSNDLYKAGSESNITSSKGITNAFGGNVLIKSSGLRSETDKKAFVLAYEGLTQEACITIVTGDWGSAQGSGLIAIGAAGESKTDLLDEVLIDNAEASSGDKGSDSEGGYGVPGGETVSTPISVTNAQKSHPKSTKTSSRTHLKRHPEHTKKVIPNTPKTSSQIHQNIIRTHQNIIPNTPKKSSRTHQKSHPELVSGSYKEMLKRVQHDILIHFFHLDPSTLRVSG